MDSKTLREWQKVLRQSGDPMPTTDPRYVFNLHGSDREDVIEALSQDIQLTDGTAIYYFTGQRGTGKSSELLRLTAKLDGTGEFRCVLFDATEYLNDTQPITVEMLLLMLAVGVRDWLKTHYPEAEKDAESPLERFKNWLGKTEVELKEVSINEHLKFNLKDAQLTIDQKLRSLTSEQDFLNKIRAFVKEMADWLKKREKREVVILVDSLERLRGKSGDDGAEMFDSVVRTFSEQYEHLRIPLVQIVYAVPPYLCLLSNIRNLVPFYSLASVRVYETPSTNRRQPREKGLAVMRDLLEKRIPDWEKVFTKDAIDKLSMISGGDLRHFLRRLMVDAIYQAQYALDRLPLQENDAIIQSLKDTSEVEMAQLTVRNDWVLLRSVAKENKVIANNRGHDFSALAYYLDNRVILNYRNGKEWYDLHPCLWATIEAAADPAP